jgi:hypothetical protein
LIRPVDTSLLDAAAKTTGAAATPSAAAEASGTGPFAAQLKREAGKTAAATPASLARVTVPDGEKWRPVKGRDDYAEIVSGDRKGQMVNLTRGPRRFEAFTIEQRDGKTVHVYQKDGKELAIEVPQDKNARAATVRPADREPPKGETWGPLKDHRNYVDVLSGPRNGWYVNIQDGSAREGMAFHVVKRGSKTFHVYGEGDQKTWVEVGAKKKTAPASSGSGAGATPAASATTPSATGGASASSSGSPSSSAATGSSSAVG